ncbi:SDR family oxidoreductase [uncultured Nevskia sp.]|uniref:SDR family NAD(P)-dependent oxidoreductase n=1 Tax=uncultured Nevskia sp. TaxID=228950 RepID=UPI0025D7016A|nr:SDR family oxidoreductase [uncultured Nevskia sp.]
MSSLKGKVAMITGAGSGIGQATARLMAERGASVLCTDLNPETAAATAAMIRNAGGIAESLVCDIGSEDSIKAAITYAEERYGGLDILHNNAALQDPKVLAKDADIAAMEIDIWDRTMAVNVRGTMLGCKHAIPAMLRRGGGVIVNTSSTYGLAAYISLPAYSASKAAINSITQHVAAAYGKRGIRCNAVAPALVLTPLTAGFIPKPLIDINVDGACTPFLGGPLEVAQAVAFLASDDARFITGHILPVDGGTLCTQPTVPASRSFFAQAAS